MEPSPEQSAKITDQYHTFLARGVSTQDRTLLQRVIELTRNQ